MVAARLEGAEWARVRVPETITFLAALPKGPTGKVLRKALRDQARPS